jgi:HAMP domain-containing protein
VATGAAGLFASWRLAEEGVTLGARLAPLSDAAMEIELTATHAHLLFEEIMAGDEGESIEEVWSLLDETRFYADAILHGGSNEDGTFHATESPRVRAKIESVRIQIEAFIESARARYARHQLAAGTGSEGDQRFDELYEGILADLDSLGAAAPGLPAGPALALTAAVGTAKYRLANAHLFLEELLSGDDGEAIETVVADFRSAATAIEALDRPEASPITARVESLAELAEARYASVASSEAAGSDADEQFDQSYESFIAEADEAEEMIQEYMATALADLKRVEYLTLFVVGTILLAVLGLLLLIGWFMAANVARPIECITGCIDDLAVGREVMVPAQDRPDEIGNLARSLATVFQKGLEAARLRAALDGCGTMIMIANRRAEIVYLNPALAAFFKAHEAMMKKDLPALDAANLVGQSMDSFHKNPEHNRRIVEGLTTTREVQFDIAGRRPPASLDGEPGPKRGGRAYRHGGRVGRRHRRDQHQPADRRGHCRRQRGRFQPPGGARSGGRRLCQPRDRHEPPDRCGRPGDGRARRHARSHGGRRSRSADHGRLSWQVRRAQGQRQ